MIQRPPNHPGFEPAQPRPAQMHAQAQAANQYPMPSAPEVDSPTRRTSRALWIGTVVALGVVGFGATARPWENSTPQPQTAGDTATNPGADQEALGAFSGTVEPSTEATAEVSPSASSATSINFKPDGTTEADVPVVIGNVLTPVTWWSNVSDGTLFQTPRDSYPGQVNGTTVVTAYWNDTKSMKLDQALTDQNGFNTYDIPSDTVNYGLDSSQLTNTVLTYPTNKIFKSLRKIFHARAHRQDARRLQHLIRTSTDEISAINFSILRQKLSRGTVLQSIIQQGQAGLEADLKAEAATQGIPADQIDFVFTGDTPPTSLAYLSGPDRPSKRGDQFRYRGTKVWNIIVQQFVNGGTS